MTESIPSMARAFQLIAAVFIIFILVLGCTGIAPEQSASAGSEAMNGSITDAEPEPECSGEMFSVVNDVVRACVGGVMTMECANESEVYSRSKFLDNKIVCENGTWVEKELGDEAALLPDEPEPVRKVPCTGKSFELIRNVTSVCVDGYMSANCTNDGAIYSVSNYFKVKIVCENGSWVRKATE